MPPSYDVVEFEISLLINDPKGIGLLYNPATSSLDPSYHHFIGDSKYANGDNYKVPNAGVWTSYSREVSSPWTNDTQVAADLYACKRSPTNVGNSIKMTISRAKFELKVRYAGKAAQCFASNGVSMTSA